MKWWKALGVAAFVGVAATGVAVARAERQRRAYTPEQVRERLHARVAEVGQAGEELAVTGGPEARGPESGAVRAVARRVRAGAAKARALPPVATIGRVLRRARGDRAGDR
ncbi:hypothetical protein NE857_15615 [Nocardiopsis exhalans]|uniref:Secreted protein n=1 Tax=Nocardiopsis exhalans TaxID=163604 RepID=A0ABY5DEX5_9ACTN|nr:hypothetical protein [Nocardiopsis exhalans]USY22909.1 hypothetical protein NE857_15615 [Nocardiopsis exhalans]